ncbi:MAG: matrixin family metalloprotease [Nitrosopumilus sp.]|nr:matrixin family metalloprotease [Nitrosopumilus sp.]
MHTLIHEIGHSMGLTHSEGSGLERTVMYPFYNEQLDLTDYDIDRIVAVYGSRQ